MSCLLRGGGGGGVSFLWEKLEGEGGVGGGGTGGDQDSMLVRMRRSVLKNGALFVGIVILEVWKGIERTVGGGVMVLCVIVGAPLGLCCGGWLVPLKLNL